MFIRQSLDYIGIFQLCARGKGLGEVGVWSFKDSAVKSSEMWVVLRTAVQKILKVNEYFAKVQSSEFTSKFQMRLEIFKMEHKCRFRHLPYGSLKDVWIFLSAPAPFTDQCDGRVCWRNYSIFTTHFQSAFQKMCCPTNPRPPTHTHTVQCYVTEAPLNV